ncbi:MAG: hypothetical protein ACREOO_25825 [bacterium]
MSRIRSYAAAVCGALGIGAILLGFILAYVTRALFNADAFSAKIAASLGNEGVATLVASRVSDLVIEQRRDLTAFRPVIIGTARMLISSAPFRAMVERTARLSHATLLSRTGENLGLSLKDAGMILQSALSDHPQLASKIPKKLETMVVNLDEAPGGQNIVKLLRLARGFRLSALTLLLLGVGMVVLCLVLAAERRIAILRIGLTLVIAALVIRLLARYGGHGLALWAKDPMMGGALVGFWGTFFGGLMTWALVLGSFGLVLAAAVTSFLERVQLQATGQAIWNWFSTPKASMGMKLLRGFALIAAGLLVVLWPAIAMTLLGFVIGALLFFIGLREFFGIGLRAIPDRMVAEAAIAAEGKLPVGRVVFVGVLALLLVSAGVIFLSGRDKPVAAAAQTIDACNGYPELCDRRINEVVFPATHNSMSASDIPTWLFPNQEKSIPVQLQDGVRVFLIDALYGVPVTDRVKTLLEDEAGARKKYEAALGKEGVDAAMRIRDRLVGADEGKRDVYMCHGFCELGSTPLTPMLQHIREFLVMNPNEVLMLVIQDEGVTPQDIEACFQESGLIDFVYRGPLGPPWPTLRELIASDQRVLVFAENNSAGVPWYHQAFEVIQETPYTFHKPEEFSCRPNRGTKTAPLFQINHWIETTPAPKPSNAEIVNAYDFLLARAQRCRRERGMLPNIVAVDFYRTGDLFKVVETLNGIKPQKVAPVVAAKE